MTSFWQVFWAVVEAFFFVAYLIVLFQVVADLFRDRSLGGDAKAVWVLFLVVVPLLAPLVYLVAGGGGMAYRQRAAVAAAEERAREYVRTAAGTNPAQEIATAKGLLDSGAVTPDEFERLKAKALTG